MKDNYTRKCLYWPGPFIIGCPNMNQKKGIEGVGQGHGGKGIGAWALSAPSPLLAYVICERSLLHAFIHLDGTICNKMICHMQYYIVRNQKLTAVIMIFPRSTTFFGPD